MPALSPRAHELLARQHGVASMADFIEVGVAPWEVNELVRRDALELVLSGAWRSPSTQDTEMQRCAAMCRAHPEVVIAGPTAGRLYGLRRLPNDRRIHVLAPPKSNPTAREWVKSYRTRAFRADDVWDRPDGIRVLRRPRLALDLARFVGDDDLLSIVEQCMFDGRHEERVMFDAAIDWISPRRRWVRRYLDALDRRVSGPGAESHLEVLLGDRLVAAGVEGLVRQHEIDAPGHGRIRFDLAVPSQRFAIEVDGFPTHRELIGRRADEHRDRAATRIGWNVHRVGPHRFGSCLPVTVRDLVDLLAVHARTA